MKKSLFALFAVLMLWSFKPAPTDWPKIEKDAFIKECVKNASPKLGQEKAESYCSCMLDKVVAKYPKPEDVSKMLPQEVTKMAMDCIPGQ